MERDREKWNRKYLQEDFPWKEPSDIVKDFYTLAKTGKVLDIACGTGRNAVFLAEKGFTVDAVDISDVALEKIKHPKINKIQADLDFYKITENSYDLIVNINFLNRRLVPYIKEGLKKDGGVIFETFTLKDGEDYFQPENREYLLRPNELLRLFSDMYIVYYREAQKIKPDGRKAFVSSLVAVKKCYILPK